MTDKIITATLHDMTPVPAAGSIYRGDRMVEFETTKEPETITKKLAEYDKEEKIYFKDKSISKLKLRADDEVKVDEKKAPITKTDFIVNKLASGDFKVQK